MEVFFRFSRPQRDLSILKVREREGELSWSLRVDLLLGSHHLHLEARKEVARNEYIELSGVNTRTWKYRALKKEGRTEQAGLLSATHYRIKVDWVPSRL